MLVDEMPRSFSKKNNSYSHCPLKKRPVNVVEDKTEIKEEIIDVVDITPEPENLSTKPEDLSRASLKRARSPSPAQCPAESRSPTIYSAATRSPSPPAFRPAAHVPYYPPKIVTPPSAAIAPVHPVAKKARVEVIQHNPSAFVSNAQRKVLVPVESLGYYPSGDWERARAAPLYSPQYLPYPAYRYPTGEIYPSYPVAAYPHSSPEHHSVSPSPPHSSFGCQSIPRPVPISSYNGQWLSPLEPSVYSPTNSVGSASLRSTPPVSPEDLSSSSPGSESGRSSVGSIPPSSSSVKLEKSPASSSSATSGTTPPRYKCGHCSKSYTTYSGMSKHEQFHCAAAEGQQKKTFTCKYCPKIYMTLGALKMHIRTHTLPCKCTLCGKAFSRPWLLQGHIRTHTGEKPFSCQHCNRAFADRSNLRAHLQTHSDVKKYSCNSCSKTFSRMSLLTKHQEGGCPSVGVPIGYAC